MQFTAVECALRGVARHTPLKAVLPRVLGADTAYGKAGRVVDGKWSPEHGVQFMAARCALRRGGGHRP